MTTPRVSIIMPVYNRAGMVHEAIASALAASSDVPLELIVVDDASTDDTWDSLRAYDHDPRVRTIRLERNGGQCAARNHALDVARGSLIKFLDSDDLLMPEHLPVEVRALEATGADIVASGWIQADAERSAPEFDAIVDDILAGKAVPTSAALYARHAAVRWDPDIRILDDWDYFCQAALGAKRIVSVAGAAYVWRDHAGARITKATMLANARAHHQTLDKIEQRLEREGQLTPARRKRLAQYFYKELRVLSLHDRAAFDAGVARIRRLDPQFVPRDEERQWYMRAAARILGFRNAVLLHSAVKRLFRK